MVDATELSDLELNESLARRLFGEGKFWISISGKVILRTPGVLTFMPVEAPDWTGDLNAAISLEGIVRERGGWARDEMTLSTMGSNVSMASARQRSEAALTAFC